jgi:hypothetical protein
MPPLLMAAVSHVLARIPSLTSAFAEAGFFLLMPVARETLGRSLSLLAELAFNAPHLITPSYASQFARLAPLAADSAVDLLAYIAGRGGADCVLTVADTAHDAFSVQRSAGRFVHILGSLDLAPDRVAPVIARYLEASHDSTVITASKILCSGRFPVPELRTAVLVRHLLKSAVYPYVYHLLARTSVQPSVELLNALLLRPTDAASWALIAKIADTKGGDEFLRANTSWLDNSIRNPKGALGVFVMLFRNSETRRLLTTLPQYPMMLRFASKLADAQILVAIATIARRGEVSEKILRKFAVDGTWKAYFEAVMQLPKDKAVQESCMAMVDAFCRVGYTDEFSGYLRYLVALLQNPEMAGAVIQVMVTLSYRKELSKVFREINVIEYFQNLRGDQYYAQFANMFLQNVVAS